MTTKRTKKTDEPARKRGRPAIFSDALADRVCADLANGRSLVAICSEGWAPSYTTIRNWLRNKDDFLRMYARARAMQADVFFDEILEIADDSRNDTYIDGDGKTVVNYDHIQRAKLRIDARKWMAALLAPKKYGDLTRVAGHDAGPLQSPEPVNPFSHGSMEKIIQRIKALAGPCPNEETTDATE